MTEDIMSGLIGRKQLAEALNCNERTIARYEALPDGLPSLKIVGRKYYKISTVRAWLDARERRPNPRRGAA